jgi:hypothetical protein
MKQVIAWKADDGTLHEDENEAFNADLEHWKKNHAPDSAAPVVSIINRDRAVIDRDPVMEAALER